MNKPLNQLIDIQLRNADILSKSEVRVTLGSKSIAFDSSMLANILSLSDRIKQLYQIGKYLYDIKDCIQWNDIQKETILKHI